MSRFTRQDQMLLSEAYGVSLLEESLSTITLGQLQKRIPYMTISEAAYTEEVIEELFGALGRVASRVGAGIGGVAGAAGSGLKAAGQSALNTVNQAGQSAINKAGQISAGVKGAAGQVLDNTKELYNSASVAKGSEQAVDQAFKAATQLIDLIQDAQKNQLIKAQGDVTDMTLPQIMELLQTAKQSAGTFQANAQKTGFTGGIGSAYNKGAQTQAAAQNAAQGGGAPAGVPRTA